MASAVLTPQEAYRSKKIKMATSGLKIAILMPVTAILQNIFNSSVTDSVSASLQDMVIVSIICSITLLALGDFFGSIFTFIYNLANGKGLEEYKRTANLKISWFMLLSAAFAGPMATGCWMAATPFCGLTMVAVITSLGPVMTVFVSSFFLKEKLNMRIDIGVIIVVCGAIVSGWEGVVGGGSNYILGICLALLAPIGFTLEGQFSTYAGDMIDPNVGCGMYRCLGSAVIGMFSMFVLSFMTGNLDAYVSIIAIALGTPSLLIMTLVMGLLGAINYNAAYLAFNRTGPSRVLAVDSSRPIWSIPLGFLFAFLGVEPYMVTQMNIIGAFIVVAGLIFTIGNPKDLVNLRDVS
jgi:drug/metabolite transporter (DMT)-like permease